MYNRSYDYNSKFLYAFLRDLKKLSVALKKLADGKECGDCRYFSDDGCQRESSVLEGRFDKIMIYTPKAVACRYFEVRRLRNDKK